MISFSASFLTSLNEIITRKSYISSALPRTLMGSSCSFFNWARNYSLRSVSACLLFQTLFRKVLAGPKIWGAQMPANFLASHESDPGVIQFSGIP
jgi:hypothetical protein